MGAKMIINSTYQETYFHNLLYYQVNLHLYKRKNNVFINAAI